MGADLSEVGTMVYPKPILDDAHFEKFIGGIKTPYTFIDEFHGFIGSVSFHQSAEMLFYMIEDECIGDCGICGVT